MDQGWGRHVQALQSPEQEGGVGKELRATPARWLHSSPWRKWGLRAVIWYTRTAFPVGLQGHFESKDYSLLMCERIFFFFCFFRLCEEIIRLIFISVAKGTWGEFKCTLVLGGAIVKRRYYLLRVPWLVSGKWRGSWLLYQLESRPYLAMNEPSKGGGSSRPHCTTHSKAFLSAAQLACGQGTQDSQKTCRTFMINRSRSS